MNAKLTLAQLTADDLGSSEEPTAAQDNMPGYRQVMGPTPASRGIEAPVLSEGVQALLIMNGCCAAWSINYWRVTRRKEPGQAPPGTRMRPGQKYRLSTGASADAPFAEWQQVLKNFVSESLGVEQ